MRTIRRTRLNRIIEELKGVLQRLDDLPSGLDIEADDCNTSPDDMVAHLGGLAYRELESVILELIDLERESKTRNKNEPGQTV